MEEVRPADFAKSLTAQVRRVRTGASMSSESETSESLSEVPLDRGGWSHARLEH